ncbi:MAG: SCO family protein [Betaproteobacteria bacterium]|nr:SCO family protein [Betaproteobacteria bacterium]
MDVIPKWTRRRAAARGALTALFVAAAGLAGWLVGRTGVSPRAALPVLFTAPRFGALVNQEGTGVSSARFRGQVQIVTFLDPYCNAVCPIIAAHLAGFEHMLAETPLANRVAVVAFDIDPATGPRQMRAFLKEYGWDPRDPHWQFLSGKPGRIRRIVTGGYHVDYRIVADARSGTVHASPALAGMGIVPQPLVANPLADRAHVSFNIVHNDIMMVVDGKGRVRRIYDQADAVGAYELLGEVRAVLAAR